MNENIKRGIVTLLGGAGLIVLLIGIFTKAYPFTTGLIIAIGIWIVTGAVKTMLGVRKDVITVEEKGKKSPARKFIGSAVGIIVFVVLILGIVYLISFATHRGSGNVVTESRTVGDFKEISLSGIGRINLSQDPNASLSVSAEDNIVSNIETKVENNVLKISYKDQFPWGAWPTKPVVFDIKVKELSKVTLSGSGEITADRISGDKLELDIYGSGKADILLDYKSLESHISGSGKMIIRGAVENQKIEIDGSGDYRSGSMQSKNASVNISGSGEVIVNASEKLDVRISGSGKIGYFGKPVVTQNISGSGKVEQMEKTE